jgi:hypothetical protein
VQVGGHLLERARDCITAGQRAKPVFFRVARREPGAVGWLFVHAMLRANLKKNVPINSG